MHFLTKHETLTDHFSSKKSIEITKCTVKRHRDCDDLELVIEKKSHSNTSDKECVETPPDPEFIPLSSIQCPPTSQQISVKVNMFKPETIQSKTDTTLNKRDTVVADSTGDCKLVLWENDISAMEIGRSYIIHKATVHLYQNINYLSLSTASEIIDDLPNVINV